MIGRLDEGPRGAAPAQGAVRLGGGTPVSLETREKSGGSERQCGNRPGSRLGQWHSRPGLKVRGPSEAYSISWGP